jgi:tetratricopeptide (TPR) repeat protein
MARASAHRKTTGRNTRKVVHPVKKAKPKKIFQAPQSKAIKVKGSARKAMPTIVEPIKKAPTPATKRTIHKESIKKMAAESGKPAVKSGISSAPEVPPRLLRPTKTTSAALALLEKGIVLIFKKEFKKARNELKTLLETYPGELDILARARSYVQICEREEATQKKQTISLDQLYALGVMEHNKANYDMAISYFLQSLDKHPGADHIYYSLAASQAMMGNLTQSIENLRKAVALNEDSRIYAKNDADFSALQTKKEFAELVGIAQVPSAEQQ